MHYCDVNAPPIIDVILKFLDYYYSNSSLVFYYQEAAIQILKHFFWIMLPIL